MLTNYANQLFCVIVKLQTSRRFVSSSSLYTVFSFRIDNTDHIIDVMYQQHQRRHTQINIICPFYSRNVQVSTHYTSRSSIALARYPSYFVKLYKCGKRLATSFVTDCE